METFDGGLDLTEGQLFSDAELDVFCQNMFQAENLSPLELDIFSEAPTSSGNASLGNGASYSTRGSSESPSEHATQQNSAPFAQQQGSEEWTPQNQQQMYQQMHGLPAISTVMYPPTGAGSLGTVMGSGQPSSIGELPLQSIASGTGSADGMDRAAAMALGPAGSNGTAEDYPTSSGEMRRTGESMNGSAELGSRHNLQPQQLQQYTNGAPDNATNGAGGHGPLLRDHSSGTGSQRMQQAAAAALQPTETKKMKEKHRGAQRRYRARLRAKQEEDQARVEELTRELDRMKAEQHALMEKNAALERHIAKQATIEGGTPAQSSDKPEESSQEVGDTYIGFDAPPSLRNRYRLNDQTWDLIKDSIGSPDDRLTFTVREQPITVSKRDVANWTPEKYKDLWKDYVNAFAVCLMQCTGDTSHPAHARLMELLAETRALKLTFCMLRPDLLAIFAVDAVEKRGMPTAAFWKGVAESLTITADQLRKMISVRGQALKNLGAMMAQRRELLTRLSRGTDLTQELRQMNTIDYLQTRPAALQMDALLRNENSFIAEISTVVMAGVLTPLQLAHVITLAWPFGVNILAIMNVLADKAGAPPVAELLRQGAANGGQMSPLREALMAA